MPVMDTNSSDDRDGPEKEWALVLDNQACNP